MVTYYNLTKLTDGSGGFMDTMSNMSFLVPIYPLFILGIFFLVSYGYLTTQKSFGTTFDSNDAIHYSSLFTLILSILLYTANVIHNTQYIYLCAIIYLITAMIRFWNK
jgi:hypothetical protein